MVHISLFMLRLTFQALDSSALLTIRTAVERTPIEAFGDSIGAVRVRGIQQLDVDGDGVPEAFVWIAPSFRQTPTILVYRYSPTTGPHPLLQALAPGRLRPVSGRMRDSHTLGRAVDLTVGHGEAFDTARFMDVAVERGMSLVRYRGFFHTDMRDGFTTFVALYDRSFPTADTLMCNEFEFSQVQGLLAGALAGDTVDRFLVALTDSDVTIYSFHGIDPRGTLNMESWLRPRPSNAKALTLLGHGTVAIDTGDRYPVPIQAP